MKDFLSNNLVVRWLRETLIRLMKKSPVYFQIIQIISGICIILPGLPEFLHILHIPINETLDLILSRTMSIGGMIGLFISSLPVEKEILKTELETELVPKDSVLVLQKDIDLPFTDEINK